MDIPITICHPMALIPIPQSLFLKMNDYNSQIHFAQYVDYDDQLDTESFQKNICDYERPMISETCCESPTSERSLPWSDDEDDYVSINSDFQNLPSQDQVSVNSSQSLTRRPRKPLPIPSAQNSRYPVMARSL
jgi:hypothetical protein